MSEKQTTREKNSPEAANNVIKKTKVATKWSMITELVAKLITPITSMLLARILAPEAFGVLTTVLMVISFAEVFVESGFQKFLVQHQFSSVEKEKRYMSVAFWTNLAISLLLWLIIAIFNNPIAELVGNSGKGHLLVITGVVIPIYGTIGMQVCKLKKDLNFKKLFYVRVVSALVPLVVTLPLAIIGLDYWALIIGNIAGIVVQSVTLAVIGSFKPSFYFNFAVLKEMFSYGIWTMLNGLAVWLTTWIDAFLIGRFMTEYYLGLYKNSVNMVNSICSMIVAAIVPVLFSSLSKLQDDDEAFRKVFLGIQRPLCLFLIPFGAGLFMYRELATDILLGEQWREAANIIGVVGLTISLRTVFVSLNGDVFRSKGHFKLPLFLQVVDLFVAIPLCLWAVSTGFWEFVYVKAICNVFLIVPEILLLWKVCNIAPRYIIQNCWHYILATAVMVCVATILKSFGSNFIYGIISVGICIVTYFCILLLFPSERSQLLRMLKKRTKNSV